MASLILRLQQDALSRRLFSSLVGKETYFGYKVHALITLEGFITAFEITSASADDREKLCDRVFGQSGFIVLGDKGYAGKNLASDLNEQGISLISLKMMY